MRIGILFNGISYGIGRDFRHCFNSINSNLIIPFQKNNDVKVFLTTYKHQFEEEQVKLYAPHLYSFLDTNTSHQVLTYIKSFEQIKNEPLDFIISTRHDIHFHKDMSNIGIDFEKMNALFKERGWWDNMKFTTDNFFAFPHSMLSSAIDVLYSLYENPSRVGQTDLHQFFHRMQNKVGISKTNIISNIDELSNYNSFYSLCNDKWGKCKQG